MVVVVIGRKVGCRIIDRIGIGGKDEVDDAKVDSRRCEYRDPIETLRDPLEVLIAVIGMLRYPSNDRMRSRQSWDRDKVDQLPCRRHCRTVIEQFRFFKIIATFLIEIGNALIPLLY